MHKNYGKDYSLIDSRPYLQVVSKKTCNTCGDEKDIDQFGKRPESRDGRNTQCSKCINDKQAAIREKRKDPFVDQPSVIYELHWSGQVMKSKDLKALRDIEKTIPEECEMYKIIPSRMTSIPKSKKEVMMTTPCHRYKHQATKEILPFKDAEKAYELKERGRPLVFIAKALNVSPEKLKLTMIQYETTNSEKEYETVQPHEKFILVVLK